MHRLSRTTMAVLLAALLAACGGATPTTGTAVAEANRATLATFAAARREPAQPTAAPVKATPTAPATRPPAPPTVIPATPAPTSTLGAVLTPTAHVAATSPPAIAPTATVGTSGVVSAPLPGSWVASAPAIHVRFLAAPQWVTKPELTAGARLSLGSPASGITFQAVDIERFAGATGADNAPAWDEQMRAVGRWSTVSDLVVTADPRPQQVAGSPGFIGQYHYTQPANGVRIDGTLWVGSVDGDRVVMNFRCDPAQDRALGGAVAQVLTTIDFDAP